MSYLAPRFDPDIFVSYSHGAPVGGRAPLRDWSRDLVGRLKDGLHALKTEFTGLSVWMDPDLDPTALLTDDLRAKASRCGVLMIVMSERYLESSWCKDELEWFKAQILDRAGPDGRVFVIKAQRTDTNNWPELLRDERGHAMTGFSFFDPATGDPWGFQLREPNDEEYYKELGRLRVWLTQRLRELRDRAAKEALAQEAAAAVRIGQRAPRLYLHASQHAEAARVEIELALKRDGVAALTAKPVGGDGLKAWEQEAKVRIETAKRCDALALVRIENDERFVDDLFGIGMDERERMIGAHGAPPPCAVLDRSGDALPIDVAPFGIARFDVRRPDWRGPFRAWLEAARLGTVGRSVPSPDQSGANRLPEWPYPGLRPFEDKESAIFFGRERMIDDVVERLVANRLVLIHGVSGSGKSSLVRAGVLPKLALQHNRHAAAWLTCTLRPSGGPLWNLAAAFAGLEGRARDLERVSEIAAQFGARGATLASVAASLSGLVGKSLCFLVDQFEELFRYEKESSRDEADLFVKLIERAAAEEGAKTGTGAVDLRVILTMRSEFLGECARFAGFAETINRTQYLVPRMDDEGLLRAVRRPAEMYGGQFADTHAARLIASVRGREDELPLLQHGLMLMWEDAVRRATPGARPILDTRIVDEAGGLAELLSSHADAVMAKAAPHQRGRRIVEGAFRALTDVNAEGSAIRRPLSFKALCRAAGARAQALSPILDAFRAPGVSFLTPYAPAPIDDETIIDISHEALIRCWRKVGDKPDGWLQREIRAGLRWRTMLFQAEGFADRRSGILSASAAGEGEVWLFGLNPAWTERYGGGWAKVETLIRTSLEHWKREAEEREAARRREAEQTRKAVANETRALAALSRVAAREGRRAGRRAAGARGLAHGATGRPNGRCWQKRSGRSLCPSSSVRRWRS